VSGSINYCNAEIIIANQDGTVVTLPGGTTVNLSAGQVYYNPILNTDMTGRHITSNKPVAYFAHNVGTNVPFGVEVQDILWEQMAPVIEWGKVFLIPNAPEYFNTTLNPLNNRIRIVASQNGTVVNFSGASNLSASSPGGLPTGSGYINFTSVGTGTLNAGQWTELSITGTPPTADEAYISASQPVGVGAYMVGGSESNPEGAGDPSLAWIPALNQAVQNVIISPFILPTNGTISTGNSGFASTAWTPTHYMIIVTPTETDGQTTVTANGIATTISTGWTNNLASGYSQYIWTFDNTADISKIFDVQNPDGVIVLCGGTTYVESYYYNAGSGTCVVSE
jgi:hypothetical protein